MHQIKRKCIVIFGFSDLLFADKLQRRNFVVIRKRQSALTVIEMLLMLLKFIESSLEAIA